MSEIASPTCPQCGAALSPERAGGLCPKCLLLAGFESEPTSGIEPDAEADYHSPTVIESGFAPPSPEELDPLFPQLEILELLGKGGMGAVYKARQPSLDRFVAVKILPPHVAHDPAFAERFTREAKALARLSHPNIVTVHDVGRAGDLYYFVMEYIDGVNLREVIRRGDLTPEQAFAIVPQICEALQYAHDEGIVHRDIKPENLLLDTKGRVKIADFGLAKLLRVDQGDVSLTGTHQVMGTLRYMAPEQVQGSRNVDHRADIYALGVVFYELLTGEVPMGRFAPPSQRVQVDVRLDEVVLRALESEPDKRYQRAGDVKTDVETVSSRDVRYQQTVTPAESVPDAVVFRRLTYCVALVWAIWSGVWIADLVGYVQGAKWYFEQDWQFKLLEMGRTTTTFPLAYFLVYWWYLLAKSPHSQRSLADFWTLFQSPDRRTLRYWIPAGIYVLSYALAMASTMALTNDAVQATTLYLFLIAAPPAFLASSIWIYGLPNRNGSQNSGNPNAAPSRKFDDVHAVTKQEERSLAAFVSALLITAFVLGGVVALVVGVASDVRLLPLLITGVTITLVVLASGPFLRSLDRAGVSWKAVYGALLMPLFLLVCGGLVYENLTMDSLGGISPSLLFVTPLAILGCLLGGLAIRDIHTGESWGLPLAVFNVLVLPLAIVNGAVIFVALTIGGLAVDSFVDPPELPPLAAEDAPIQERLDARNAQLRVEYAHQQRLERTQKNIAATIAIPTCLLLDVLILLVGWRIFSASRRPKERAIDCEKGHNEFEASNSELWFDWWRDRPRELRRCVHVGLLIVYGLCLVMFFTFRTSGTMVFAKGHEHKSHFQCTIGSPEPWYVVEQHEGGHSSTMRLLSPTLLLAVLAYGTFGVYYQMRLTEAESELKLWEHPTTQLVLWAVLAIIAVLAANAPLFFP